MQDKTIPVAAGGRLLAEAWRAEIESVPGPVVELDVALLPYARRTEERAAARRAERAGA